MRKILKRLGMLMLISVSCMSQSVQIPLHAQTMLAAPATREEVKISPTDVIRKGFKVRVETPKGLHDDYENKWVIKMSEKSSSGYDSCVYSKIWIDDQRVYCVDPLTSVMNGAQDYEQISFGAYVNAVGFVDAFRVVGYFVGKHAQPAAYRHFSRFVEKVHDCVLLIALRGGELYLVINYVIDYAYCEFAVQFASFLPDFAAILHCQLGAQHAFENEKRHSGE